MIEQWTLRSQVRGPLGTGGGGGVGCSGPPRGSTESMSGDGGGFTGGVTACRLSGERPE